MTVLSTKKPHTGTQIVDNINIKTNFNTTPQLGNNGTKMLDIWPLNFFNLFLNDIYCAKPSYKCEILVMIKIIILKNKIKKSYLPFYIEAYYDFFIQMYVKISE